MRANKRFLSLIVAATLVSTSVVGCGSFDSTATVLTIGGEEVSAGVANFYARYQQALYEDNFGSYLGDDLWITQVIEGETYQETVKANIMDTLQELYVISQHAEELEISISEEELEAIEEAAQAFMDVNTNADNNELASVSKENAVELLSLLTLQKKAEPVIKADVDTEVSDEDSIQKKMTLTGYEFEYTDEEGELVTYAEEEIEAMYSNLEGLINLSETEDDLLTNATAIGAAVEEITFDDDFMDLELAILEVAKELELNEYSEIIETGAGYYLIQLTSLHDEEATAAKTAEIIGEREVELYDETIATWIKEADAKVVSSVWSQINFEKLGVLMPEEDTSGITTYESTYEYGSNVEDDDSIETLEETTEELEEATE